MDRLDRTAVDAPGDEESRSRSQSPSILASFDDRPGIDNEHSTLVNRNQPNVEEIDERCCPPYVRDIVLTSAAVSVPMLALSILLVCSTFAFRVDPRSSWFRGVGYPNAAHDSAAFYINFSSTRYVTITSWASNIGTTATGAVMILFSYWTAKRYLSSQSQPADRRNYSPTPYQLNLFLQARGAGVMSFWQLKHYIGWKVGSPLAGMVIDTYVMLAAVLLLGYTIWAADTWLHVSTESVLMTCAQVNGTSVTQNYSYYLNCYDGENADTGSCSTGSDRILEVAAAFQALNNLSDMYRVSTLRHEDQSYAFLSHANLEYGLDFEAHTFAVTTQCLPVPLNLCQISCDLAHYQIKYTCLSGINDTFQTSDLTQGLIMSRTEFTTGDPVEHGRLRDTNFTNPFSFITFASSTSFHSGQFGDPDHVSVCPYVNQYYGMSTWLLNCSSTTAAIEYRWQNSSAQIISIVPSNNTIAATLASPFLEDIGSYTLYNAVSTAMGEPNATAAAEVYGEVFSKTAMALAAGVFLPSPNLSEARFCAGSRVPKWPLITLLVLMMIYVVTGVVLGILALASLTKASAETQARLTIQGVTAHAFETRESHAAASTDSNVDNLFEEKRDGKSPRILLNKTNGRGWRFSKDELVPFVTTAGNGERSDNSD